MITRRPAIVKDVLVRGSINTSVAFVMYAADNNAFDIKLTLMEKFFEDSFKVQLLTVLIHLLYDIYLEYASFLVKEECDSKTYVDDEQLGDIIDIDG